MGERGGSHPDDRRGLSDSAGGVILAAQNLISSPSPPSIISVSYGACELTLGTTNAIIYSMWQQAAAEGISVFVAAGKHQTPHYDGPNSTVSQLGLSVNGLASTPFNVATGSTDFDDTAAGTASSYWSPANNPIYGSAISYIPEIPWNNTCASTLFAAFQGFAQTYGASGFCNSALGVNYLVPNGGGGGRSDCATNCAGYPKPSWQRSVPGIPDDGVQ